MNKTCAIFDLDGTLFDDRRRAHHIPGQNWDAYFEDMENDDVVPEIVEMVKTFKALGADIIINTARPRDYEPQTLRMLRSFGIEYDDLYMRPFTNTAPSAELKRVVVKQLRKREGYEILMAFDDEPRVVQMYREEGVPCVMVNAVR